MKRHSSKKKTDLHSLLRNRNVLYVVLFFSTLNLFSYLMMRQLDAVAFFIIIGFLTTYFSKNMIIVMLTSIVSTFFLVQINLLGKKEGMKGMKEGMDSSGNTVSVDDASDEEDTSSTEDSGIKVSPRDSKSTSTESFSKAEREDATAIKPEKFTQKLSPARYNSADDDTTPRHKPKIDYAATLETAYDNLDKLLSSDTIKNMSADTGRLADKQKQLMDNIGKLTPIMDKASSVLNNLDMGGISGLMGGIQDRLKGFGAAPAEVDK